MRSFVLVTAVNSGPGRGDVCSSGIRKLKRGLELSSFATEYISQFNLSSYEEFTRGSTLVVLHKSDVDILQWTFTEYKEEDLLHAVRHLTREELLRDLKELLPFAGA